MASSIIDIPSILDKLSIATRSYLKDENSARESLIDLSQALIHALELPSESIQRMGWTEVMAPELYFCSYEQFFFLVYIRGSF